MGVCSKPLFVHEQKAVSPRQHPRETFLLDAPPPPYQFTLLANRVSCPGQVVEFIAAAGEPIRSTVTSLTTRPSAWRRPGGYVNIIKILLNAGAEINSR